MSVAHSQVRTRFAPSPTGFMHIGNLRTALYEYLVAKSQGGSFILRIEDTDQERLVAGAVEKIYESLSLAGLKHDEGPDIGGDYGPYVQSERLGSYRKYALELVETGHAYRCFCTEERLAEVHESQKASGADFIGYDRHCRNLSPEEIEAKLESGAPYVIRQKMPLTGITTYNDAVYGEITFENKTLEDQVLLKSDGFPTYNFANVVDDHAMRISHVVRGSEYLSSTPKYVLLYEAFGYEVPVFVHLPLILGKDGQKLSKRHGATSFEELVEEGYLPEAIINYLALLGWAPKDTRELFTLSELEEVFAIDGISKSPSVFDEDKLLWFNEQYLRQMPPETFTEKAMPFYEQVLPGLDASTASLLTSLLQNRTSRLNDIPGQLEFLTRFENFDLNLFVHKKSKTTLPLCREILHDMIPILEDTPWTQDQLYQAMVDYAQEHGLKNGQVMWPIRIGASGQQVTPGGAVEVLLLLGKEAALARLKQSYERLGTETELEE